MDAVTAVASRIRPKREENTKSMEQRLSVITLGVTDLKRSRAFYEKLGWKVATEEQADSIVAFNLHGFVLALYPLEGFAEEVGQPVSRVSPSLLLAYSVASEAKVDQLLQEAEQIGATIVKRPQKMFWGGYSGCFSDPDGYLWEVDFNPFAKLGEDGTFRWMS